jgi:hypothetical protein
LAFDVDRCGIDSSHVQDVLKQTIETLKLRDGCVGLRAPIDNGKVTSQVLDGDANGRERSLQVVAQ